MVRCLRLFSQSKRWRSIKSRARSMCRRRNASQTWSLFIRLQREMAASEEVKATPPLMYLSTTFAAHQHSTRSTRCPLSRCLYYAAPSLAGKACCPCQRALVVHKLVLHRSSHGQGMLDSRGPPSTSADSAPHGQPRSGLAHICIPESLTF